MLKKLSIVILAVAVSTQSSTALATPFSIDLGPQFSIMAPCVSGNPGEAHLDTYAGRFFGWLECDGNTAAKTAITALLAYCVAYTLYQTARGVGSTVLTWWNGEKLSPSMQRQVEISVAELIRKNGMGQMIIRSAHHEGDGCTCAECCGVFRARK